MIDLHKLDKFRLKDTENASYTAAPATAGNSVFKGVCRRQVVPRDLQTTAWDGSTSAFRPALHSASAARRGTRCALLRICFRRGRGALCNSTRLSRKYINNHPYCLHLWKPVDTEIPHPPMICV